MKYLVFGVWHDAISNQVATHSKEIDLAFKDPEDEAEEVISDLCKTGLDRGSLYEVFVYKSAQNYGDAPELAAHWTLDDGLFGEDQEDEPDEDEEG